MAHLQAVLVIGEDRRGILAPGNEDLGQQAEALADEDGRRHVRVAGCRPVGCVRPLRHGDHIAGLAALHVLRVNIGSVLQGGVDDFHGSQLQRARHQQVARVDRHSRAGACHAGSILDQQGLCIHLAADCIPFCSRERHRTQVGMPARSCHHGGVEQCAGVSHSRTNPAAGSKDSRHQARDLAQPGCRQLARVGFQLVGLVPIDQLERERDVAAVLGEIDHLRAVTHRQLGIGAAFRYLRQAADRADQRTGHLVERVEVLHSGDLLPPVISRPAQLVPAVDHHLVEGVLDQPGEIGGGRQAGALRVKAAVQVVIAGECQVQLADTAQPGRAQRLQPGLARSPEQVVHGGLQLVFAREHGMHPARPLHRLAGGQFAPQAACIRHGMLQLQQLKRTPAELAPDAFTQRLGKAGSAEGAFEQHPAHGFCSRLGACALNGW